MASNVIAFRFSDEELEILQQQAQEGESLSQVAKRLLRGTLGIESPSLQGVDNVNELVNRLVNERLTELQSAPVDSRLAELEEKIGYRFAELEEELKKLAAA